MHDGLAMAVETKIMAKVDEFTQTKLSFVSPLSSLQFDYLGNIYTVSQKHRKFKSRFDNLRLLLK
jgi:hypothetical protein